MLIRVMTETETNTNIIMRELLINKNPLSARRIVCSLPVELYCGSQTMQWPRHNFEYSIRNSFNESGNSDSMRILQ